MIVPKIRRMLNDSGIGRKINGFKLGLYVEAVSREILDSIKNVHYDSLPKTSFEAFMFQGHCPVLEAISRDSEKEADPKRAYSWTTPFYQKVRINENDRMERVPTDAVLKRCGV